MSFVQQELERLLELAKEQSLQRIALAAVAALLGVQLARATYSVIRPLFSPLRHLRGPPRPTSWLFGHDREIMRAEDNKVMEGWFDEFGSAYATRSLLGRYRLNTLDPRALHHILFQTDLWQRPEGPRRGLERALGKGLLFAEGDDHRIQRRIMNPAFGPAQIRELTDVFLDKSSQLRDILLTKANDGPARIDILHWLSRTTLDIIGIAGFNYQFDALNEADKPNALASAFDRVFRAPSNGNPALFILANTFPILRPILRQGAMQGFIEARKQMDELGMDLLRERKAALLASGEKPTGRDLLTLLLQQNMSPDIPPAQRLTDAEVLAQVPTFLVAGHETTSTSTTWCLWRLAQHQDLQERLRAELAEVPTDAPDMETLNGLPLLEAVVREALRLHAPVIAVQRAAVKDDIVPLKTPVRMADGSMISEIRVRKGDSMFVPIQALNRSRELWGPDALEFKPERWMAPPADAQGVPGVMSGLLTFIGGPRACIGWKFAVIEMKALLFHLIRALRFELAVPAERIGTKATMISRPIVKGELNGAVQMPLIVSAVQDL